jgi:cytidylate kinase
MAWNLVAKMSAATAELLDQALLLRQDARTSEAVIAQLLALPAFVALSARESADTAARDRADDEKLQAGVDLAVAKGVLPAGLVPAPYHAINVEGKATDDITAEICGALPAGQGAVIVLVGLSGTGKGTTVARLAQQLPKAVTWSNGNVFRALTLLAVRWCEAQGLPAFDADAALTPANLAAFMAMLDFGQHGEGGAFDIKVSGLGVEALVAAIANTDLKAPAVSRNIPTVANATQGEVVAFVAKATAMMSAAGHNVIIEGREATVNHIPTPYRFALTLQDPAVIGRRRAAQRIMAAVAKATEGTQPSPADIDAALRATAESMAAQ